MTGAGLPAEGVPLDNPAGSAGSGSLVTVRNDTRWTYIWDTGVLENTNVQTARYTIYAIDLANPSVLAKSSVMIYRPSLPATASPNPVGHGDLVTITGSTSLSVDHVSISVVRVPQLQERSSISFEQPLMSDGTFTKQFHADLPNGNYEITITTPGNEITTKLSLVIGLPQATETPVQATVTATSTSATTVTTAATTAATPPITQTATTPVPSEVPLSSTTILYAAIVILVIVAIVAAVLVIRSRSAAGEEEEESEEEEEEE
jgi:hypothetical protein